MLLCITRLPCGTLQSLRQLACSPVPPHPNLVGWAVFSCMQVAEIMGKLGGRSRQWLLEGLSNEYKAIPEYGLRIILAFSLRTSFLVPLDRCVQFAMAAIKQGAAKGASCNMPADVGEPELPQVSAPQLHPRCAPTPTSHASATSAQLCIQPGPCSHHASRLAPPPAGCRHVCAPAGECHSPCPCLPGHADEGGAAQGGGHGDPGGCLRTA